MTVEIARRARHGSAARKPRGSRSSAPPAPRRWCSGPGLGRLPAAQKFARDVATHANAPARARRRRPQRPRRGGRHRSARETRRPDGADPARRRARHGCCSFRAPRSKPTGSNTSARAAAARRRDRRAQGRRHAGRRPRRARRGQPGRRAGARDRRHRRRALRRRRRVPGKGRRAVHRGLRRGLHPPAWPASSPARDIGAEGVIASDVIAALPAAARRAGAAGLQELMALRAVAEVNLAAIERNAALLRSRLGAADAALRGRQGRRLRPRRGAGRAGGAARRGASFLAVATAEEAAELRRAGTAMQPILVLGAISEEELPVAVARGAELTVWDERFVQLSCAQAGRGCRTGTGARQARHRPWPARHARCRTRRWRSSSGDRARRPAARAGRRDDALRHGRRRPGVPRQAARGRSIRSSRRCARSATSDLIVHAANSAAILLDAGEPLRHGARRDRAVRRRPDEPRPGRPRARAGARAALLRRGGQADRRRARAPATGAASSPSSDSYDRDAADRLRRRDPAGAGQQLRRADRRPPLPAARDGQHGQHHRRRRARSRASRSATAPR